MDNATLSAATYDAFRAHPLLRGARAAHCLSQQRLGPADLAGQPG